MTWFVKHLIACITWSLQRLRMTRICTARLEFIFTRSCLNLFNFLIKGSPVITTGEKPKLWVTKSLSSSYNFLTRKKRDPAAASARPSRPRGRALRGSDRRPHNGLGRLSPDSKHSLKQRASTQPFWKLLSKLQRCLRTRTQRLALLGRASTSGIATPQRLHAETKVTSTTCFSIKQPQTHS